MENKIVLRFFNYKSFYIENVFESFVNMLLWINPHISWLNLICIIIDMTQRSTLHMSRIIHTRDDVSQKCCFIRRVNIIPQLRRYLRLFLDVLMELITLFLTKGYSVRTKRLFKQKDR